MKRVVISGAGTINSLGHSVPDTLEAMREGRCGISQLEFRDVERLSIKIGGQVRGFEAEGRYNRQQMSLYDRFTQFTLAAAKEAIDQSGVAHPPAPVIRGTPSSFVTPPVLPGKAEVNLLFRIQFDGMRHALFVRQLCGDVVEP